MTPAVESHSPSIKFIVEGKPQISPTLRLFPCDRFPKSTQVMFYNNYRTEYKNNYISSKHIISSK